MAQPDGPQSEPQPVSKPEHTTLDDQPEQELDVVSNQPGGFVSSDLAEPHEPHSQDQSEPTNVGPDPTDHHEHDAADNAHVAPRASYRRRTSRSVIPELPRAQTFARQKSEERVHLAPVEPSLDERRNLSMDRRSHISQTRMPPSHENPLTQNPASSAFPSLGYVVPSDSVEANSQHLQEHAVNVNGIGQMFGDHEEDISGYPHPDDISNLDAYSDAESRSEDHIYRELETKWILNISMHFKDLSKREKFFVTYREDEHTWRRVTVSLDYRQAPPDSLEMDLLYTDFQRDKSRKIYDAIRDSLPDIQFYDTVTNLKLETTNGRLHVHVVEDANEIIRYPSISQVQHLGCRIIDEMDLQFDSHMSGFVYKVHVDGVSLIKKEIPGPDAIEEFLYEINALNSLAFSDSIIQFHGLVVDGYHGVVKGLLISFAEQGSLVDIIYEWCKEHNRVLDWAVKERWARQVVQGLADVHESGFVQGDFTLSNIVVDEDDNAKIIDINRRGCPVGWEPPEATPLVETGYRISLYIGVKSDLYQLGMVLWALAMEEDEPEKQGRPLELDAGMEIPDWYRKITETCLNPDPRRRLHASMLLAMFPAEHSPARISVEDGDNVQSFPVQEAPLDGGNPRIVTVEPAGWDQERLYRPRGPPAHESWHLPPRGRSPPSPMPSNLDQTESEQWFLDHRWAANKEMRHSYSDAGLEEMDTYSAVVEPVVNVQDEEHYFSQRGCSPPSPQLSSHNDFPNLLSLDQSAAVREHTIPIRAISAPAQERVVPTQKETTINEGQITPKQYHLANPMEQPSQHQEHSLLDLSPLTSADEIPALYQQDSVADQGLNIPNQIPDADFEDLILKDEDTSSVKESFDSDVETGRPEVSAAAEEADPAADAFLCETPAPLATTELPQDNLANSVETPSFEDTTLANEETKLETQEPDAVIATDMNDTCTMEAPCQEASFLEVPAEQPRQPEEETNISLSDSGMKEAVATETATNHVNDELQSTAQVQLSTTEFINSDEASKPDSIPHAHGHISQLEERLSTPELGDHENQQTTTQENTTSWARGTTAPVALNDINLKKIPTAATEGTTLSGTKSEPPIQSRPFDGTLEQIRKSSYDQTPSTAPPCVSSTPAKDPNLFAGIGTGHRTINDDIIRENCINLDEDFYAMPTTEAL